MWASEQTSSTRQNEPEELLPPFSINMHDTSPSLEERELGIPVIDEQTRMINQQHYFALHSELSVRAF